MNSLLPDPKKLKIPPGADLFVSGAPESLYAAISGLGPLKTRLTGHQNLWVMAFVRTVAEMMVVVERAFPKMAHEGILWVAFPKKSSGMQSDLNRDTAYSALAGFPVQWLSLISLDDTWSAFALRSSNAGTHQERRSEQPKQEHPFVDSSTRTVLIPDYLQTAFSQFPDARAYFDTLAFTNRKEYVVWLTGAKKDETRKARLEKMISLLQQRKRNPTEK